MFQQARIRGTVREFSISSVVSLIGDGMMSRIRAADSDPFFFEMHVAHEGESKGALDGVGVIKQWLARTVRAIAHAFNPSGRMPALIYDGQADAHGNEDNRTPIGEVVFSRVINEQCRDTAQAIGWIYPKFKHLAEMIKRGERDCCSIEADVTATPVSATKFVIDEVLRATGIVIAHSTRFAAGFPGALVRRLAEFEPEGSGSDSADAGSAPSGVTPPASGAAGAGVNGNPPQPPAAPAQPAPVPPTSQVPPTREQLIAAARAAGITAIDLAPVPVPVTIPAPPAQPTAPASQPDFSTAEFNPFLPQ